MLQNARVTAFTVSELLRENQQGVVVKITPPPTFQIRDKLDNIFFWKLHVFKVMYSYSY